MLKSDYFSSNFYSEERGFENERDKKPWKEEKIHYIYRKVKEQQTTTYHEETSYRHETIRKTSKNRRLSRD